MAVISASCFRTPSLTITDEFIRIKNPGESWALIETKVIKYDSTENKPLGTEFVRSYVIVDRESKEHVKYKNIYMDFSKKNPKYQWAITNDKFHADRVYQDTIQIKPFTWYDLSSRKNTYGIFFYWNGKKGDYIIKGYVANPGAW